MSMLAADEILAAFNFPALVLAEGERQVAQSQRRGRAILRALFDEKVCVLRGIGEAEENRAGFAEEEIADAVALEAVSNFLRLPVFKCGHNPASPAGSPHTSAGNRPSCRKPGTARRP